MANLYDRLIDKEKFEAIQSEYPSSYEELYEELLIHETWYEMTYGNVKLLSLYMLGTREIDEVQVHSLFA